MQTQAERDAIISESAKWFSHNRELIEQHNDLFCDSNPTYAGGIAIFSYLSLASLEKLVEKGYANKEDAQNSAPTLGEFLDFLKEHPDFVVNGYSVTFDRMDCRVTITGLEYRGDYSQKDKEAFEIFTKNSDENEIKEKYLYSWWD